MASELMKRLGGDAPLPRAGMAAAAFGSLLLAATAVGQQRRLTVAPASLELRVGQTGSLEATMAAADGSVDSGARVLFFSLSPADVSVSHTGVVSAHRAGEHTLVALAPAAGTTPGFTRPDDPGIRVEVPVRVLPSALASLRFVGLPERVFAGASLPVRLLAEDEGAEPRDVRTPIAVAPAEVATVASFGPLLDGRRRPYGRWTSSPPDTRPNTKEAVGCLSKDRDALLACYDFPAEHWRHIRTKNPIESVFATVRHRTLRSKRCRSHATALTMVLSWSPPPARPGDASMATNR